MPRDLGQRAGLTRERVLSAASELAAEDGLPQLTIRSLAQRLDVAPNAVYGWVQSKAALLDALVDDVFDGVANTRVDAGPVDCLKALLLGTFDAMIERPELAPLFLDRATSPGPNATAIRLEVTALLGATGIAPQRAAAAVPVLVVHTLGFGSFVGQTNGAQLIARPHVGSPRDVFTQGLNWLLDGITAAEHEDL